MTGLRLSVSALHPDTAVLSVAGDIDVASTPELRSALHQLFAAGGHHRFVIDLDEVGFIDSSGLGALVGCIRRLPPDGELRLVCGRRGIIRVFEITGLDAVLRVEPTLADALLS